jgi:hypothetical protein
MIAAAPTAIAIGSIRLMTATDKSRLNVIARLTNKP